MNVLKHIMTLIETELQGDVSHTLADLRHNDSEPLLLATTSCAILHNQLVVSGRSPFGAASMVSSSKMGDASHEFKMVNRSVQRQAKEGYAEAGSLDDQ